MKVLKIKALVLRRFPVLEKMANRPAASGEVLVNLDSTGETLGARDPAGKAVEDTAEVEHGSCGGLGLFRMSHYIQQGIYRGPTSGLPPALSVWK